MTADLTPAQAARLEAAYDKRKYPDTWRCGHGFSMPEHWTDGYWSCPAFRVDRRFAR